MTHRLVWLLAVVLVSGCAATGERGADPAPAESGPLSPDDPVRHSVDNRAVAELWERAEQARRDGDYEGAVMELERAVRLAPGDPVLWSRMAELYLQGGDQAVAENLAVKSNALAEDNRLLRYRNWLIISEARDRRDDEEGAERARAEAERIRSGSES